MRKELLISPNQSAAFAMGRVLLELDCWRSLYNCPIDLERGMLIDFAVQYPRSLESLVPEVKLIIETNRLSKADLGDLFARKHFGTTREKYQSVINDLLARSLVNIDNATFSIEMTELGINTSVKFSSSFSLVLRSIAEVFCIAWKRKAIEDLSAEIRRILPKDSESLISLGQPFGEWIGGKDESLT